MRNIYIESYCTHRSSIHFSRNAFLDIWRPKMIRDDWKLARKMKWRKTVQTKDKRRENEWAIGKSGHSTLAGSQMLQWNPDSKVQRRQWSVMKLNKVNTCCVSDGLSSLTMKLWALPGELWQFRKTFHEERRYVIKSLISKITVV